MLSLFLFSPLVSPVGLILALWAYPWRKPVIRPYIWFVAALTVPLLALLTLQAAFALPPGSCVERPLNNIPLVLALASVAAGATLAVMAKGYRKFVVGIALVLCPLTLFWAMVTTMSLAGCWI